MDPSGGGGIGKAAGELMEEMKKAQNELQQLDKIQGGKQSGTTFQGVMDAQGTQNVQTTGQVQESHKVLLQAKVNANLPTTRVGSTEKAQQSRLTKMLDGLIGGQDRMTKIMNMALSGRQFSPPELIAMQAGVYRFSQELELTSKVVEKATSGIKQTMNTQV
ncbi:ATP-dependent helicase HrpB [Myxococcota bacterium]